MMPEPQGGYWRGSEDQGQMEEGEGVSAFPFKSPYASSPGAPRGIRTRGQYAGVRASRLSDLANDLRNSASALAGSAPTIGQATYIAGRTVLLLAVSGVTAGFSRLLSLLQSAHATPRFSTR